VDWLGFDPVQNAFRLDPYRYCPWFAAGICRICPILHRPAPGKRLLLEGMDPQRPGTMSCASIFKGKDRPAGKPKLAELDKNGRPGTELPRREPVHATQ